MKNNFSMKDFAAYMIFGLIAIVVAGLYKIQAGLGLFLIFIYIIIITYKSIEKKNEDNKKYVENLDEDFDSLTKTAIFNMPHPLVVTDEKGIIIWYNTHFLNLFEDMELMNENIDDFIKDVDFKNILKDDDKKSFDVNIAMDYYRAYVNICDTSKSKGGRDKVILFYFVNNSAYFELKKKYTNEYPIVVKLEVDNYDEAMDSTPSANKPQLIAAIDSTIRSYFEQYDALFRKYNEDSYLVILDYKSFLDIREKRFDILDDLRELNRENSMPITLSIGTSSIGLNFKAANVEADSCLDIALGRGGDQAVIKVSDNYEFFGGKSKAVEKRNKVKARVIGEALRQLIDRSENVYVMGHINADMDAIGAAIGVLRATLNRNKDGFIVLEQSNPSIDNLLKRMKKEEPETYRKIVSRDEALSSIKNSSLLILVDNHKPSFTECPKLLNGTTQVVVIDHHRRGGEFVKNPVLTYVEPYASSTCELITEMLEYMSDDLNLTHFEADALMSGIVVDTKNFSFQTGVRTFEAASTLRRAGADMTKVKALFEDDFSTMIYRAEVIQSAKIIGGNIAVAKFEKELDNSVLVAAQSADALLEINGIDASFVMTLSKDKIHISGRSRGEVVSVQLILEKIGGGGHLNMAGAQLDTKDFEVAEKKLTAAINEYMEENKENKDENNSNKRP